MTLRRSERLLVGGLWLGQIVLPGLGIIFVLLKWRAGESFGPLAGAIAIVSCSWLALALSVLIRPGWRARLMSRRGLIQLLAAYFVMAVLAAAAEIMLLGLDLWAGLEAARPLAISQWALAGPTPRLDHSYLIDPVEGSRFARADVDANFNPQGFRDRHEFLATDPSARADFRILLIGDSFAYGSAAVNDGSQSGFADLLEQRLSSTERSAAIWNTGIPGTGQIEQQLHLRRWLPVMRPHVVLLALYAGNDFEDNLRPPAQFYVFDQQLWANRYVDGTDPVRVLSPREAWLRSQGYGYEPDPWWLRSRLTSVLVRMVRQTVDRATNDRSALVQRQLDVSRQLVEQMRVAAEAASADFQVLVIPTLQHVSGDPDHRMMEFIDQLSAAGIDVIQVDDRLTPQHYMPAPDLHWNKSGHALVADFLAQVLTPPGRQL